MIPMMFSGNVKIHLQIFIFILFLIKNQQKQQKTIMQITIGKFQELS
jgi:hypothetical protein